MKVRRHKPVGEKVEDILKAMDFDPFGGIKDVCPEHCHVIVLDNVAGQPNVTGVFLDATMKRNGDYTHAKSDFGIDWKESLRDTFPDLVRTRLDIASKELVKFCNE